MRVFSFAHMKTLPSIDPQSDGSITITLMADAVPLPDATVVAGVFAPSGLLLATDLPMPYTGAGGVYALPIDKAWSTGGNGEAIEGVFEAQITSERFGKVRSHRVRFLVKFDQ